jgi:hypothetical protein
VLRPNLEQQQFEGAAAFDASQFLMQNKLVKDGSGGGFDPYITQPLTLAIVPGSLPRLAAV